MGSDGAQAPRPAPDQDRLPLPDRVLRGANRVIARTGMQLLSQPLMWLVVWLAMLAVLAVDASTLPSLYDAVVPISIVVAVLQAASLPFALTRPRFAVGIAVVATAGTTLLTAGEQGRPWPVPVITLVALALLVFILAVREPWPVAIAATVLPVVVAALCAVPLRAGQPGRMVTNLVTVASILALVVTFGILIHQWLRSRAELVEQQEIAAVAEERRHVMEERNRIARELHDVVAHGLSVISIQASTLRYRIADVPEPVLEELDEITESARHALMEMRGLLAVLRQEDSDDELAPQPTLSSVPALVESTRRSAETVRLHVTGDLNEADVSEATSLSVYRIVQEALSNALRHAPGAEIDVRLTVTEDRVEVEVENSPPAEPAPAAGTEGFGLRGMKERAAFVRGSVSAEPTPSGGFLVRAVLPCHPVGKR